MTLSILHISDLHRDPANPIGNEVLLSSLLRDRDRYTSVENPRIPAPNFIIVSGDIVQGVKHGTPDAEALLKRQYEEALSFFNALTEEFVDGDKDRVVVVPGNHDVSDDVFRRSLKRIDVDPDNGGVGPRTPGGAIAQVYLEAALEDPDGLVRQGADHALSQIRRQADERNSLATHDGRP